MLARRVIAISHEKGIAKRLGIALKAAGGTVESYDSIESLGTAKVQAALIVLHLNSLTNELNQLSRRIVDNCSIIVVVPNSDLSVMVAAMDTSAHVAGILVANSFSTHELAAMASRVLYGDVFGLEKLVPWGTRIYSTLVGDYQEKSLAIAQISEYASLMGVRRKYRDAIERAADEMLMNALYDAPVDSKGKSIFADVPTKTRISLRMEQKAVVQYSCDGDSFLISVRDSFGTLERETVLTYLNKCLHSEEQIDRKEGGAGLGLYIMANAATEFTFNVLPGIATECVYKLDVTSPGIQLQNFAFYNEKIDAAGRLVGGASKLVPSGFPVERRREPAERAPRAIIFGLGGAIVLLIALIGMIGIPRLAATPTSSVQISTNESKVNIELNGKAQGETKDGSLVLDKLEVGRAYRVKASLPGWRSAETVFEPIADKTTTVSLTLTATKVSVRLESEPSEATVLVDGNVLGTTPFRSTELPPSQQVELIFRKIGYKDLKRPLNVPPAGGQVLLAPTLSMSPRFGSVQITSDPSGALVFQNDEMMAGLVTPVDEHIIQAKKRYTFTLKLPGYMPVRIPTTVGRAQKRFPVHAKLKKGGSLTVRSTYKTYVRVIGAKQCSKLAPLVDCALANGTYKVRVTSNRLSLRKYFTVKIKSNDVVRNISFGIVEAKAGFRFLRNGRLMRLAAYDGGTYKIKVVGGDGKQQTVSVKVSPGKRTSVP